MLTAESGTLSPSTAVQHSRQLPEVKRKCPTPKNCAADFKDQASLWGSRGTSASRALTGHFFGLSYRIVVRQSTARLASHKPLAIAVKNSADVMSPRCFGNKSGIGWKTWII